EIAPVVGEETREVNAAERRRRLEPIAVSLDWTRGTKDGCVEHIGRGTGPQIQRLRERCRLGRILVHRTVDQRVCGRLHHLIEGDIADASLELYAAGLIERVAEHSRRISFRLSKDEELIELDEIAIRKTADRALEAATEPRDLANDETAIIT